MNEPAPPIFLLLRRQMEVTISSFTYRHSLNRRLDGPRAGLDTVTKRKISALAGNRTPIPHSSSQQPSDCIHKSYAAHAILIKPAILNIPDNDDWIQLSVQMFSTRNKNSGHVESITLRNMSSCDINHCDPQRGLYVLESVLSFLP
jgi:hypothetical protein